MSNPNIAVVGSLNMDIVVSMPRLPAIGETISGTAVHYVPGGKGANQAIGCSRLGADTVMIGCVGADLFGDTLRRGLEDSGVSLEAVEVLESAATGTAHISHTPEDNCIVVVPGANGECTPAIVRKHGRFLAGAGAVLAQLEIPLDAVREAFAIAREGGAATILNPAPARPLPEELLRLADYITPNESEWALLFGSAPGNDEELESSLINWEERYGCKAVVTRGEKGCSYVEQGRLVTVPAPRVRVVDTTGAGDCFNAALAYGLTQGKGLPDAVRLAVRAASLSVQTFGAQAGMPTLAMLEEA